MESDTFLTNESSYLLGYIERQRNAWTDKMNDRAAHADIIRRDYAAEQIKSLDSMARKIRAHSEPDDFVRTDEAATAPLRPESDGP